LRKNKEARERVATLKLTTDLGIVTGVYRPKNPAVLSNIARTTRLGSIDYQEINRLAEAGNDPAERPDPIGVPRRFSGGALRSVRRCEVLSNVIGSQASNCV
jgi:hypothetical protein